MTVTRLRLGYVLLTDSAPLLIAQELGFAAEEGLALDLVRLQSWAQSRDLLGLGGIDAAHMLVPLPIAQSLGLGPAFLEQVRLTLGQRGIECGVHLGPARHGLERRVDRMVPLGAPMEGEDLVPVLRAAVGQRPVRRGGQRLGPRHDQLEPRPVDDGGQRRPLDEGDARLGGDLGEGPGSGERREDGLHGEGRVAPMRHRGRQDPGHRAVVVVGEAAQRMGRLAPGEVAAPGVDSQRSGPVGRGPGEGGQHVGPVLRQAVVRAHVGGGDEAAMGELPVLEGLGGGRQPHQGQAEGGDETGGCAHGQSPAAEVGGVLAQGWRVRTGARRAVARFRVYMDE
ncbi:MAG: ABC transporter substrate-binding protein [Gemmobacter sp.]